MAAETSLFASRIALGKTVIQLESGIVFKYLKDDKFLYASIASLVEC